MPRAKLMTFTDVAQLRRRARALARNHGHAIGAFEPTEGCTEVAFCTLCGLPAGVNPDKTNGYAPTFGAATVTRCVNGVGRKT